jgi:ribulose 1,5-bisphosphate carboxylase large subunit-like protein
VSRWGTYDTPVQATYQIVPPVWGETLAILQSVSLAHGPTRVRARVVAVEGTRVTIDFPALDEELDAEQLLAACIAGEWADRGDFDSCRLVDVAWPKGFPGPAVGAERGVTIGAIVKPALGLTPEEAGTIAAELAAGGATLLKDDELMASPPYSPLTERVRRIVGAIPPSVRYAPNVSGPPETLLARAEAAVEAGAGALMVNGFLQGLGSIGALRGAELGVPLFVHRVGSSFLRRGGPVSVSARVLAELTRLLGADYVQVGSFSPRTFDTEDEAREQIAACRSDLGVSSATAVIGGGVGAENAAEQLTRAGTRDGVMLLLGSAAYAHPDGVRAGVAAAVAAAAA